MLYEWCLNFSFSFVFVFRGIYLKKLTHTSKIIKDYFANYIIHGRRANCGHGIKNHMDYNLGHLLTQ